MSKLSEADFRKMLTNDTFSGVYMIYGDEKYYVKYFTEKLIKKVAGNDRSDFNFHEFKDLSDLDAILSAADVIPFTTDYNCVFLNDIDTDELFKNLKEGSERTKELTEKIMEILSKATGETIIIISQPTVNPKSTGIQKKIIDFCDKNGTVLCVNKKTGTELYKMLIKSAEKRECILSMQNAERIVSRCGNDMNTLHSEMEKLCAYAMGREITTDDIDKVVTANAEYNIFKLSDSILADDMEQAFKILDDLFYQKQAPEVILALIIKAYCDMYRVRTAIDSGIKAKDLLGQFDYTGNKAFLLERAERSSKKISTQSLRKMLDLLFEAERKMKSTSADNKIVLETLVSELVIAKATH